ncbi:MAG: hypothetical protein ACQKBW_03630, partial [Puniceicoccales bacterium]
MSPLVYGGDYSLGMDDPDNTYDAPVPGFVGPAGEGKVPLEGEGNDGNYVNPVFTGWAGFFYTDGSLALVYDESGLNVIGGIEYSPNDDTLLAEWQIPSEAAGPVTADN